MLSIGLNLVKTAISRITSYIINELRAGNFLGGMSDLRSTEDDGSHKDLRVNVEV
tara:strand:- start:546 stop:710 length:165 start_codon:yes stop_codon:yes gene_type:complete